MKAMLVRLGHRTLFHKCRRLSVGIPVALLLSVPSFAQYGGGTMGGGTVGAGSSTPSYGHGKAIGIGVGTGAAGAAGLYLLMRRGSSVTGCVQPADDGLRLVEDKSNRSFSVMPSGAALVPGQHVHLRGKIIKQQGGTELFEAKKLVKNLGTCGAQSTATQGGQ